MNSSRLLVLFLLVAGLAASPALARHGNGQGNRGAGPQRSAYCDGSGTCTATPRHDGSGKALKNRGNPNSTGTPLKDGSGKAAAPGKGAKDGTGPKAVCPKVSGS